MDEKPAGFDSALDASSGGSALKGVISPGIDVVKTITGIVEVVLRVIGVIFAVICIITAAACQGFLNAWLGSQVSGSNIYLTAGWIIFISFWVVVYQAASVVQLFIRVKFAYAKVPCNNWSVFFLLDMIAIGIAAGGYFCGALPMAFYAGEVNRSYGSSKDSNVRNAISSAGATAAFSFFALFHFIGLMVFFIIARYVFKHSTHGEVAGDVEPDTTAAASPE